MAARHARCLKPGVVNEDEPLQVDDPSQRVLVSFRDACVSIVYRLAASPFR
jgi:hypothetical protein